MITECVAIQQALAYITNRKSYATAVRQYCNKDEKRIERWVENTTRKELKFVFYDINTNKIFLKDK